MADRIGQQLGNYRLLRLIGQGSFADVYLGEHIHLRTQAAIKVLQVRLVASNIQNFLNEARTIAHLVHPYIIRVLDFGVQEDKTPFLVMDYAPKGTFRQRFLQGKPLPPAPLVSYMRQTSAALQYAHDRKLIHRDVKPENMLMGPNDEVLLTDFGFALIAQSSTSHSLAEETAGTASYMAPEQLQGKPRPASDQYALGIIAYEWLCGRRPFEGSFFEIASQHVLSPAPPLHEKISTIPREIEQVVMTALEKDPQRRFPNVRDFALALEDACLSAKQYGFDLPGASPKAGSQEASGDGETSIPLASSSMYFTPLPANTGEPSIQGKADAADSKLQARPFEPAKRPRLTSNLHQTEQKEPAESSSDAGQRMASDAVSLFPEQANKQMLPHIPIQAGMQPGGSLSGFPSLGDLPPVPGMGTNSFASEQSWSSPQLSWSGTRPLPPGLDSALNPSTIMQSSPSLAGMRPFPSMQPEQTGLQSVQFQPSLPAMPPFQFSPTPLRQDPLFTNNELAPPLMRSTRSVSVPAGLNVTHKVMLVVVLGIVLAISSGLLFLATINRSSNTNNQSGQELTHMATATQNARHATATAQAWVKATATATDNLKRNPYTSTGVLVMNDSLSNDQSTYWHSSTNQVTGAACQFGQDGYHVIAPTNISSACLATNIDEKNFTYEVQMTFLKIGTQYSMGGIVFRGNQADNQYYRFGLYASGRYSLDICTVSDDACTILVNGRSLAPIPSFNHGADYINQVNTVAIVANENIFTIYVNNQQAFAPFTDSATPFSGTVGVFANGGKDATTEVVFSNARLWNQ